MEILSAGQTDIGQKRKSNQDSIYNDKNTCVFCVADGMGGHSGGDIASQMSVKILEEFFQNNQQGEVAEALKNAVVNVNKAIFSHAEQNQELKGMGTTMTCLLIAEAKAVLANVGDSRTYLINQKKIFQLTRDHSLVQEKLNEGIYDRLGAQKDPQKNVLIRSVGFEENINVDIYLYKINKNDLFVLCSDGLHGKVSDEDILYVINQQIPNPELALENDLELATAELIRLANLNGGQDNISVVMVLVR